MPIISISLNDRILRDIDKLKEDLGFSGRSEVIRAGMRMLSSDVREKAKLVGKVDGVLLVVHEDRHNESVSSIRHSFQKIIKTHIHNQLENHRCLEIFVVSGEASEVKNLASSFQANKGIEFTKLIVS